MTLKDDIDRANPNTLSDACRIIKLGQTLLQDTKQTIRRLNIHALGRTAWDGLTLDCPAQPDDCKAARLLMVRTLASGVAVQEYTLDANDTTPATLHAAIQPTGNIALLAADAVTSVDIEYMPARGDVMEAVVPVVASFAAIPAAMLARGVIYLCECEALAAALVGNKIVLTPAAGAPAATQCRLSLAKDTVQFAGADAVTSCRIKCLCGALANLGTLLESTTSNID